LLFVVSAGAVAAESDPVEAVLFSPGLHEDTANPMAIKAVKRIFYWSFVYSFTQQK